jgi:hypothetical protein
MKDYLRIKFPNGDKFNVPTRIVAINRANYYAKKEDTPQGSTSWEKLLTESHDKDELLDWVENNMDWLDLQPYAERVDEDEPDYSDMFHKAKFKLI